jgi:predicted nucleic acid-binding protein
VRRYLLDTTVLIDLSKGVAPVGARLDALVAAGNELGICAVTAAEFFAGVPPAEHPVWEAPLTEFAYWDISPEAAVRAGAFQYLLARRGRKLHTPDALVAGLAAAIGATVLTDNAKDFPVPDVVVESVRA